MNAPMWVRRSRWVQVALLVLAAAGFAVFGPGGIGVVAGLGLLVLLPALLFVDDPATARGLPVATAVLVLSYLGLLHDFRHDALGDAFAFVAFAGPLPLLGLLAQAICLAIARALPRARAVR
jgi:hypothetical protein